MTPISTAKFGNRVARLAGRMSPGLKLRSLDRQYVMGNRGRALGGHNRRVIQQDQPDSFCGELGEVIASPLRAVAERRICAQAHEKNGAGSVRLVLCVFDEIAAALPQISDKFVLLVFVGSGADKYDGRNPCRAQRLEFRRDILEDDVPRAPDPVLWGRAIELSVEYVFHILLELDPLHGIETALAQDSQFHAGPGMLL